jgi:6-pyruvoyl-tetrahydropterin synthase
MALLGLVYTVCAKHSGFGRPLHAHDFRIEITFEGKLKGGAVEGLDFNKIKGRVERVVKELDGKNLNKIIDLPTVENIAVYLIKKLKKFPIHSIKVWETADRFAEVFAKEVR